MVLIAAERDTYTELATAVDGYTTHSPGVASLPVFLSLVGDRDRRMTTVLDAGCCTGQAGVALAQAGFDVTLCDLTDAGLTPAARALPFYEVCLWHDLSTVAVFSPNNHGRLTFDYVYCCDVLEHLPRECTLLAVDQLLRVTRHGLFLTICLQPDRFGVWVGKSLHRTVDSFIWWRDRLALVGRVSDARDLLETGLFWVQPR